MGRGADARVLRPMADMPSRVRPRALSFGAADAPLAGWLHPSASSMLDLGVLVCAPFGFEEVCAHRSLRALAEAAAEAGLPALRFDLPGTGNSSGEPDEPGLWPRWVAAVHAAADELQAQTGVSRIAFVGLRLGAALAALAAVERDDVVALAAIAPVVRGRSYLRELRMLGEATAPISAGPINAAGSTLESAGFLVVDELQAALQALDLRALPRPPAHEVLIVPRDDAPAPDDWSPVLRAAGARARVECWPGYAQMTDDPQRARVPAAMVQGVTTWLRSLAPASRAARRDTSPSEPVSVMRLQIGLPAPVLETALALPVGGTVLAARLTAPLGADQQADTRGRPAVLLLNSGAVHLMGPNRLWTHLARRWAAEGRVVLRFDISGIGDSPASPDAAENVVYSVHAQRDIEAAIEHLRRDHGVASVTLVGLCSGAFHALKAAVAGRHALEAAVMINPLTYFWKAGATPGDVKEYELFELGARYRSQVFTLDPWKRLLRGELNLRTIASVAVRRGWKLVSPTLLEAARLLRIPLRQDVVSELHSATQAGTRMHFVFAARAPGYELLRRKAGRALHQLLLDGEVSIDFIEGADHTFTRRHARAQLIQTLDAHVRARQRSTR
jgi:pimeloyl-ACP methyl ester carboxylesterase